MNAHTDADPVNWNALKKLSKGIFPLLLSIVLGLASGVPVQASSVVDYDAVLSTDLVMELSTSQASYYIGDGMSELRVPVYMRFTETSVAAFSFSYWSGMNRYNVGLNWMGVDPNSPINVNIAYFEGVDTDTITVLWNTSKGLRIFYNNYHFTSYQGTYREVFLGYMVYQFDNPSSGFTFTFPTVLKANNSPANNSVRATNFEYGFAQAVADGINDSQAVQDIYDDLSAMKSAQSTFFQTVSQDLYYIYSAVQSLDQWSNMIYTLLYDYIHPTQNPGEAASEAGQIAESMAAQEAAASASLAALSPGNMADLDAVEPLGILDTVSNSTQFWGTLVQEFSTASGAIWGVFIFALLVGLIGFILRLR